MTIKYALSKLCYNFLKFKMSSVDLYKIVNAEIHPEDLMFDKKIKISGDISIIS